MTRRLTIKHESWPIAGEFTISRGSKIAADVVVLELEEDGKIGRGECVPYARYSEAIDAVMASLEDLRGPLESGVGRQRLRALLRAGAARNAADCALWDLEAKQTGTPVWKLASLSQPKDLVTAFTLSLDTPEKMGVAAAANAHRPVLKLKLSGPQDLARVQAVRQAAPNSALIVDANESWSVDDYKAVVPQLAGLGVILIEQPFAADQDSALLEVKKPIPVCADESCHDVSTIKTLIGKYQAVNIKLDKTGGLTEALALMAEAKRLNLEVMVGCMVATSLAMAPAFLLAQQAKYVDLDGPLLLSHDRSGGFAFTGSLMHPNSPALWG